MKLDGLARLTTTDQQQEAEAIALVLREALETPGARAALVTPDRELAGRVAAGLLRYGVVADDSAGEPLAETPPAVFLRLLVRAVAEDLAPVPLLALLKHPLAAAGLAPVACRAAARDLETLCLRGQRPSPGLGNLRLAVNKAGGAGCASAAFLGRIEACLEPALRIDAAMEIDPRTALAAVIEAGERLAETPDRSGPARLWAGEEGDALATRIAAVQDALGLLPNLRRRVLPGLLDAVLKDAVVRSRRALRGRSGAEHPRIFIWGLLEARLQTVDVMVLGGLVETVWPPAAEPGPWLSRPMRVQVGLPAPEQAVGQTAHDFVAACCSAPRVVLSCPVRRDAAPTVPARWLTRLDMFLAGRESSTGFGTCVPARVIPDTLARVIPGGSDRVIPGAPRVIPGASDRVIPGAPRVIPGAGRGPTTLFDWAQQNVGPRPAPGMTHEGPPGTTLVAGEAAATTAAPPDPLALPEHPASSWVRLLDLPAGQPTPVKPPRPCPPVSLRPRRLSVTEIETWLRDPYAIHAKHVLKLFALPPLDEATDAADYGTLVHDGLHRFLREVGAEWPAQAEAALRRALGLALADAGLRQALQAWWSPRLERITGWVMHTETGRRALRQPVAIVTEATGAIDLQRPGGSFRLIGRADRIERHGDGGLSILDYKTGTPPSQKDVDLGLAPQLLLEAVMAAEGGFGTDCAGSTGELIYWHLSGGFEPGKATPLFNKKNGSDISQAVTAARDNLCRLIDEFDSPDRAYLARPHPGLAPRFSDYEQLARVAEWSATGDADE